MIKKQKTDIEFTCADFTKLTLQEVSDVLMERLEDGKPYSLALLKGMDQDGNMYNLRIVLEVCDE